ncbi:isoprenylcysteine carboxylmethyltransferase family protein [Mycolicibacterium vanbaalenii]|uniref:methyltransferase family protein n=1 Tax=Mycolicibacterium vanbaalenii TaxID=110539 RepID=UPI001F3EA28E|nr:isoprenylcysteine carboxylmethyltransferase family protein [Mycolicibacterium vanbaalenii]UJL27472.1 isoprenylcysteine carboxylmethyltransferase family protein [Mycolicibacterium vanbaalenii]WND59767.1 isoprenylcysteine carboxylmethyltransferase family protein [Mycolicibacterium vanbaalenii]
MKPVLNVLMSGLVQAIAVGLLVFVPAGTFDYWQAWVFLAVFALSAWIPSIYLQLTNPAALQRRMRGGPAAEARPVQKIVMAGLYLSLAAMCVVSGLDHRFGWSTVPASICWIGSALVAVGLGAVVLVITQNNYASTTVRVEAGQHVVSTGLYGLVRHPMYTANVIMLVGIPLALGSYWALLFVVPGLLVLASRIRDEEKLLHEELAGYREYTLKVRYRLVPAIW